MPVVQSKTSRPRQLKDQYDNLIDKHLADLVNHNAVEMLEIEDFANLMFIHPTHLSNIIKEITGISACGVYQHKIMKTALMLLADRKKSIRDIALLLTFEPSQFTKWFKRHYGMLPKQYRQNLKGINT
jgi:AraC-like DNA-binding protein